MRLLLTRPRAESEVLAAELRALGDEVIIEPMLEIVELDGTPSFDGVQAVLATSANGVRALAARTGRRDLPVFTVGDATARAAREAGYNRVESAQGASAALFRLVTARLKPADGALLHVRGRDVAGDLAATLEASGFEVRSAVLYAAEAATALSPEARDRLAAGQIDAVLFFSPRTARTFVKLAGDAKIGSACTATDAICLSPAVAEAVAPLPWRGVRVAESPDRAAMIEERNRMQTGRSKDDGDKAAGTGKPATGSASQNDKPSADKAQTDRPKSPSTLEKAIARDAQERNGDGPKSGDSGPDAGTQSSGTEGGKGTPPSSHGRLYGIVGVLVLFLVLAAAYIAWPLWGPALPGWMRASLAPVMEAGRGAGAGRQVDALAAKVAGLEQDVAAIRSQLAAQPKADPAKLSSLDDAVQSNAGRIKALQDDVAALRQKLPEAGQSDKLAALTRRVAEAESRIAALAAEPGTKAAVEALDSLRTQSSARMTVLERENDALHKLIAAQEKRLAALEKRPSTVAGTTRANALVIAVGQLREEVRGTAPFASALDAVQALATGDAALQPEIDALTPPSKTGVPDLAALRLHFERIARRIASEAYVPKGKGWLDKTLQQISRLVTVRRSGPEAATRDDENGRVARAELRLAAGDLSGAVAALDGLSGTAANIAAPWLKDARARLAVNRAVDRLFSEALRRTAAAGKDTIGG